MAILNNFTANMPWQQQGANPYTVGTAPNQGTPNPTTQNFLGSAENVNQFGLDNIMGYGHPQPFAQHPQQQHPMMQPPPQQPAGPPAPMAMPPPPPMQPQQQAPPNPMVSAMNQALMGELQTGGAGMMPTATQVPPNAAAVGGQNRNLMPLTGA